jgi:hypothetical protein
MQAGVIQETAFPTIPISAPGVQCNRSRHKPTVQSRSGRGTSRDHERPAPALAQSTAPNTRVLLAGESGNSKLHPAGRLILAKSRLEHVSQVLAFGNGTLPQGSVFDRFQQALFASGFHSRPD